VAVVVRPADSGNSDNLAQSEVAQDLAGDNPFQGKDVFERKFGIRLT
jgi:hypothetical protein